MSIVIIQLSDIHFKTAYNTLVTHTEALARAIVSTLRDAQFCLIAVTGDIAFSGKPQEYEVADKFFDQIRTFIAEQCPSIIVEEIFIPGNHDCNFPEKEKVRGSVLEQILQSQSAPSTEFIDFALSVQDNFFNFLQKRVSNISVSNEQDKLYYTKTYQPLGKQIQVRCFNTAWMSRLHEQPSQLFAPIWGISNDTEGYDLVLTLFHHPYNWLEPNNGKAFIRMIEDSSDILMSGHEHVSNQFSKQTIYGSINEYFEGAVLQESNSTESGFQVIDLDLEDRKYKVSRFTWFNDIYMKQNETEWKDFVRNANLHSKRFENSSIFLSYLNDPETTLIHPTIGRLSLLDIFIYPDLDNRSYVDKDDASDSKISSQNVLAHIVDNERILIIGGDKSGKTLLSKKIYIDLQKNDFIPILIDCSLIKIDANTSEKSIRNKFEKLIRDSFEKQYYTKYDYYQQTDKQKKVILIDNTHNLQLNNKGLDIVLKSMSDIFGKTICFSRRIFDTEDMLAASENALTLWSFKMYQIREFGHSLRGKIISNWYRMGMDNTHSEKDIFYKISQAEKLVNTILGKNLLPAYPIFVLSILQTYESETRHNVELGSYGYYYEALLTASFAYASKGRVERIGLDMLYAYTSLVAYNMFISEEYSLDQEELNDVAQEYRKQKSIRFDTSDVISRLEEALIIRRNDENRFFFTYTYIYYYFVAKYIADNLYKDASSSALRMQIKKMTDNIHIDDYSNIILFLVYLTEDEQIIKTLLNNAKELFADIEAFNFDTDADFVNKIGITLSRVTLPNTPQPDNIDKYRGGLDSVGEMKEKEEKALVQREVLQKSGLEIARKNLQIMGQILRNFPGTLQGSIKFEVASESYLLSLRILSIWLKNIESNSVLIKQLIIQIVEQINDEDDKRSSSEQADELMYVICQFFAYSSIKDVSQFIGSEALVETYKEVYKSYSNTSFDLIDTSIKMDHFQSFPASQILSLYQSIQKNTFAANLLRLMVRNHLYLFPVEFSVRSSVCKKLKIEHTDPAMFNSNNKKFL